MLQEKTTFALYFGNRGFFPETYIQEARTQLCRTLHGLGCSTLLVDENLTRYGGVETATEGRIYADFLQQHAGEYDGVILCLPNFGDENGALAALEKAGTPIFIQAYPDSLDRMAPQYRRDAFCGKFSIMDVFFQQRIPFTIRKPHVVHPTQAAFAENIDYFERLCRVVKGMRRTVIGAIGARTTAFKTVRVDEITLQRHNITVETVDMAEIIEAVRAINDQDGAVKAKLEEITSYAHRGETPEEALRTLAKMGVVLDRKIEELGLNALAIRCWLELQTQLGISPCVLLGMLNDSGITAACEVDIAGAVMMRALRLASGQPAALLDWNNNYGDQEDKCILFHCGPVPSTLMTARGQISDHGILAKSCGVGRGYGCNVGRIAPCPVTVGGLLTENGQIKCFVCQGEMTDDPIPDDFFGCAGVLRKSGLQDTLLSIGYAGFRHHAALTPGLVMEPLVEALTRYLGYEVSCL